MQFTNSLVVLFGLVGAIQAQPVEERAIALVPLTFHGGPASYELLVPTNGKVIPTNNALSVSIIDTGSFDAFSRCTFNTPGPQTLVPSVTPDGVKHITVGPPQPVLSVSCH
ncbi:hypothetical protein O1611_g1295 [Lasiodiplodia mahajangana]|uniref:Uncharacterized protein n=1 Tax=Lasiodiplodia mahajangana TaxID=1108764 RepID=A0ACC2JY21_9PEZI|nr:hypothetical protein O1611_g1295 [Lasiodiplodia mahajangana]